LAALTWRVYQLGFHNWSLVGDVAALSRHRSHHHLLRRQSKQNMVNTTTTDGAAILANDLLPETSSHRSVVELAAQALTSVCAPLPAFDIDVVVAVVNQATILSDELGRTYFVLKDEYAMDVQAAVVAFLGQAPELVGTKVWNFFLRPRKQGFKISALQHMFGVCSDDDPELDSEWWVFSEYETEGNIADASQ
jgi:hypothetical protein